MATQKTLDFYQAVYEVVRLIPEGKVTSYGAIAKALGANRSSRLVGYAMNNSHGLTPPVPAHRVVNRTGLLTGRIHFNPPESMQSRLESEGIKIKNHQVQNFDQVFWNPLEEIQL